MATASRTQLIVSSALCPGRETQCEPVTIGVPLPRGYLFEPSQLVLADEKGRDIPIEARATERWPDGSIRWILLDFQVTGRAIAQRTYELRIGNQRPGAPRLTIEEAAGDIVVDTSVARFRVQTGACFPFAEATIGTRAALDAASSELVVIGARGEAWRAWITRASVEKRGELQATVRLDGIVGPRGRALLEVVARVQFFAGTAAMRVAVTLRNPRRAQHRGGFWELGDRGSVHVRDVSLHLGLPAAATGVECAQEAGWPFETFVAPLELYQDSSGGENWRALTHLNRRHEVSCTFRGYRLAAGADRRQGLRATPSVAVRHHSGCAGVAFEHFWQNFPKAIEVEADALIVRLFPRQFADVHELQGGEQKTHRFTLWFGEDAMARDAAFWGRTPARVAAQPRWYCASGAVPYLSPAADDRDSRYQQLISAAIEGNHSFERKRETIDEYGWRNFGDIYADHENTFSGERAPIVSHYNNQYDAIGGFAAQFMRTGDVRWWRLMNDLATHVTDIDIYHTDRDKAAYNHGLFWHTYHYVPAGTSSHRSYPRHPRLSGGGPANEHNYTAGLRLHWLLTGEPQSRDAAIALAQWVIDMDDGRKTILRWLSSGDTGLASQTASSAFQGPGRGAGHSILALLDGHRLTEDRQFLTKAEQVIRRCIHPADDVTALNLLDAERRWSYTAFLQALGKYLDYKAELGEIDLPYAYGRAALLHYASWMADHEYPYLDNPEILEYPTETWAAQDMRKCEVFMFAAQHASAEERERLVERAQFYFDYSVSTLLRAETRALARPLVLLLSNGFMHLASHAAVARPTPPAIPFDHFGSPTVFVPQKVTAKKRLAAAAAILAAAAIGTIACLAIR